MKTIYFPPCGYAFWYVFGKFKSFENIKEYDLIGSSSSSIICLISLLKPEHQTYELIMEIAEKVQSNITFPFNLNNLFIECFDGLLEYIDVENLEENLKRIKIQVTRIKSWAYIIPTLEREVLSPKNLSEFREMGIAASYIPFISRIYPLFFCYSINGKYYIDGGFYDVLYGKFRYDITFETRKYSSMTAPSKSRCYEMYLKGLHENDRI
jgi:hypothetical protein